MKLELHFLACLRKLVVQKSIKLTRDTAQFRILDTKSHGIKYKTSIILILF